MELFHHQLSDGQVTGQSRWQQGEILPEEVTDQLYFLLHTKFSNIHGGLKFKLLK